MKFQLIEITFAMIDMNLDNHESNKSYEKKVDFCIDDSILVDGWIRMRRYDKEFKWWWSNCWYWHEECILLNVKMTDNQVMTVMIVTLIPMEIIIIWEKKNVCYSNWSNDNGDHSNGNVIEKEISWKWESNNCSDIDDTVVGENSLSS